MTGTPDLNPPEIQPDFSKVDLDRLEKDINGDYQTWIRKEEDREKWATLFHESRTRGILDIDVEYHGSYISFLTITGYLQLFVS